MSLQSLFFVFGFLPLFLLAYYCIKDNLKNLLIVAGSCAFYAFCSRKALVYLITIFLMTYVFSLIIDFIQSKKQHNNIIGKLVFGIILSLSLIPLMYFKYKTFFLSEISSLFNLEITPNSSSALNSVGGGNESFPGLSFITFTIISYLIDCFTQKIPVQKNPINLASYILMFPKVLMGPIERYSNYRNFEEHKNINSSDISEGFKRFLIGFCKKTVIADNLASIVALTSNVDSISEYSVSTLWVSSICFSLQIFFDFSGYSDMAIGIAQMMGFRFKENFNYPYIASSITDFWRRWHISLSFWFRDYVYIPLGGSRKSTTRNIFTLLCVWFLTGLWHGAAYTFIVWGLIFFICILFERYVLKLDTREKSIKIIWRICTLFIVNLNWVFFQSPSIQVAFQKIKAMFGFTSSPIWSDLTFRILTENSLFILLGILFCFPVARWVNKKIADTKIFNLYSIVEALLILVFLIWGISFQILGVHNPFLYQQF